VVFKVESVSKSYDGPPVIHNFSCEILRGDKIGVVGNNGPRKIDLFKMLAGKLAPESGLIEPGHNTEIGYFPQNHSDIIDKTSKITVFEWLKSKKEGVYDQDIRSILG